MDILIIKYPFIIPMIDIEFNPNLVYYLQSENLLRKCNYVHYF